MEHLSELDALGKCLDDYRAICRWKVDGLNREQSVAAGVKSGTSILGTLKHLAYVERFWYQSVLSGVAVAFPWTEDDPDADWRIEEAETVDSVLSLFDGEVSISQQIHRGLTSADSIVAVGNRRESVRSVLIHLVEEIARHAGHLDILREQIDGATKWGPPKTTEPAAADRVSDARRCVHVEREPISDVPHQPSHGASPQTMECGTRSFRNHPVAPSPEALRILRAS
jgi:uncharacterized damage-inducible protein DinB